MIISCAKCGHDFDDQFRTTVCPHEAFLANDGSNNFARHTASVGPDQVMIDRSEVREGILPFDDTYRCAEHPDLEPHVGYGLAGGGFGGYFIL